MSRIQIFIRRLQSLSGPLALGLGLAWVAVPMAQAQTGPAAASVSAKAAPAAPQMGAVTQYLTTELGDADAAAAVSQIIASDILVWKPPVMPVTEVNSIVAYAFGNRIADNGNRSPGPMNQALAEQVVRLYQQTGAPVYAQWEIAESIGDRIPKGKLITINPGRDAQAEPVYLSTVGVANEVVKLSGGSAKLGKVAVIGFYDHIKRCVDTSIAAGMVAAAPAGYDMPREYDAQSGQPWTRSRLAYLMHDIRERITDRRDLLVKSES